jgi:hypothetical protein
MDAVHVKVCGWQEINRAVNVTTGVSSGSEQDALCLWPAKACRQPQCKPPASGLVVLPPPPSSRREFHGYSPS